MKFALLLISTITSLVGCVKLQIDDSISTNSHVNKFTTITILSKNLDDENFAKCLQRELKEDLPKLKAIPEDKFRDALFPWFEPGTAPKDAKELSALLSKPLISKHIDNFGVDILVYVQGETTQSQLEGPVLVGGGYPGAVGAFGYVSAERETHIHTTVWDLKKQISLGDTDVDSQGKFRMPLFIIPIPIPSFTESAACSETAKRISDCLKNNDSLNDK